MAFTKCFDFAEMVIDEKAKQVSPFWALNSDRLDDFEQCCSEIDLLIKETEAETLTVDADNLILRVSVILDCKWLVFKEGNTFERLTNRALNVQIIPDGDRLEVSFVFPSLWDRTGNLFYRKEVQ